MDDKLFKLAKFILTKKPVMYINKSLFDKMELELASKKPVIMTPTKQKNKYQRIQNRMGLVVHSYCWSDLYLTWNTVYSLMT